MKLNDLPSTAAALEPQEISRDVLAERFLRGDEKTADDVRRRTSRALASVEAAEHRDEWAERFYEAQCRGVVLAGRINSAAGTDIRATLINCFVQGIGDSVSDDVDGKPSIYKALAQAAETMRRGGGVGYDFSRIRPKGARVHGTQSLASGPVSYMRVFDRSCETVESAGARRGAQMGILRCDHPDILEFVHAKDDNSLSNFNLSVGITDAFMEAVDDDAEFELVHDAEPDATLIAVGARRRDDDGDGDAHWVYRRIRARELLDVITRSTYDHADPGVVFLDRMNRENNLGYAETLEAVNPCAEQCLPDYGCCCLGSIDLTRLVVDAFSPMASFDWQGFQDLVALAVRMLDNVLDLTYWPLEEQRAEAMAKRRIGLGFLGLGSALVMLGVRYDSLQGVEFGKSMAQALRDGAYRASIELAQEKGPFLLLDVEKYLKSGFAERLPPGIRHLIRRKGIRNSHLLSIAPTGTISLAFADNASNGIEPAFAWVATRHKRQADGSTKTYQVEDHAWRVYRSRGGDTSCLPPAFVSALVMSAQDHLRMLQAVQPFIDASISKTVNIPEDYPFEAFRDLYLQAWKAGLKGLATYRPNPVTGAVLSVATADSQKAAPAEAGKTFPDDDPLRRQFDGRPAGELEGVTSKVEYWTCDGQKTVYVIVNFMRVTGILGGETVVIERPVEFFLPAGQRDEGQQWIASHMRLLSMVARSGGSIAKALANMRDVVWDKGTVRCGTLAKADGSLAPRYHDSEVAAIGFELQCMLMRRGILGADGEVLAALEQARLLQQREHAVIAAAMLPVPAAADGRPEAQRGKRCPECGAHALHRIDGCWHCTNCGHTGSCG